MNKSELMKTANEIRKGAITGVYSAKSGHPGGSLSIAEILTYLYFKEQEVQRIITVIEGIRYGLGADTICSYVIKH